jgi:hypothetical protein
MKNSVAWLNPIILLSFHIYTTFVIKFSHFEFRNERMIFTKKMFKMGHPSHHCDMTIFMLKNFYSEEAMTVRPELIVL